MTRPATRPYNLMLDLLYSPSEAMEHVADGVVVVRSNVYLAESGVSSVGRLEDYLNVLVDQGYVRKFTKRYGHITVYFERPPDYVHGTGTV